MADTGLLGIWCGPLLGSFFREAGLTDLVRRSWLVECWAPLQPSTRQLVTMLIRRQAGLAPEFAVPSAGIPSADQEALRAAAEDPDRLLGDPDFCFREAFVVTLGRVPA
jgi:hypothetical protein